MRQGSRTVDPALTIAAIGEPAPSGSMLLPLSELGHRRILEDLLHSDGATSVLRAGEQFARTSDHELVLALATSSHPHDLVCRFRRVERLFHLGHRTDHELAEGSIRVHHVASDGPAPTAAESLFVFGSFIGMCRRIGVDRLDADITDSRASTVRAWPLTTATFDFLVPPLTLRLSWAETTSPANPPEMNVAERLRLAVAQQPARRWTVATAASMLGTSPRSLQRAHLAVDTTVSGEIIAGRIDAATALLERTDLNTALIAALCGFADAAHFNRCFRRRYPITPARHRASRRTTEV